MKLKGWNKLILQILFLSGSMITLSFITDTQLWLDYFNFKVDSGVCNYGTCSHRDVNANNAHYHMNYRGIVYVITGVVLFIVSALKMFLVHKEVDFKNE